jgi:hypothetical protein
VLAHHSYLSRPNPRSSSNFTPKSRNKRYPLGTFWEILERSASCPFCSLVIQSIKTPHYDPYTASIEIQKTPCYVTWEVDGRGVTHDARMKARTRRLHVHWDDNTLKDSYLVYVAPAKYLRFNSDAQNIWEPEALFLGRDINSDGNNHVLMKSWLDLCCRNHDNQCRADLRDKEFNDMVTGSYFGVIDVLDMRLLSLPPGAQYVALSYVWGTGNHYTTTLENILIHRNQGGLGKFLERLPDVIRDAMDLVRRLGERYIWIDSLCIVQNSTRSWKLNADVMNVIYGNAILTICAADGDSAWTNLKAMHPSQHLVSQPTEECAPGVRLMVTHLAETGIRASAWDTRAWTFQERLLSRRCLIFTEGRVFFQCRSTTMSEDIVAEPEGAGWSLDLVQAPPQMLRELECRALWVYTKCVELYSSRNLSKPKDIIAAFNGVSNLIGKAMEAPFIFGLPSSHFDLALLWEPLRSLERRKPKTEEIQDYQGMEFPSWSWCGWMGQPMAYKSSMIEGCLTNVYDWLMEHTWISWYIRDGHGDLRPLWGGEKSKQAWNTEWRWRGYSSKSRIPGWNNQYGRDRGSDRGEPSQDLIMYEQDDERRGRAEPPVMRHDNYAQNDDERVIIRHQRDRADTDDQDDDYGRLISPDLRRKNRKRFWQTLPENPYCVIMAKYDPKPGKEFPDQPILQFWTWFASLRLTRCDSPHTNPGTGLCRYDIADDIGDWCGSIVLDERWIAAEKSSRRELEGSKREFIALSDAKNFTTDECGIWTYYIPKERDQSEWDLYYVLLVERERERAGLIWHRVALGKVFKAAFSNAIPRQEWKEIILG